LVKKAILFFSLIVSCISIFLLFRIQERALEKQFNTLKKNKVLEVDKAWLAKYQKPTCQSGYFFHFTSAHCPYNKLGFESLNSLYTSFNDSITFFVIASEIEAYDYVRQILKKNNLSDVVLINDENGIIQDEFKINSFPRAVIIDRQYQLFYEGNYNHSSILCGFGNIDYGNIALKTLIKGNKLPPLDYFVMKETDCY